MTGEEHSAGSTGLFCEAGTRFKGWKEHRNEDAVLRIEGALPGEAHACLDAIMSMKSF